MHVVITDSGVGGLSVCAYAERFVRIHGYSAPVRLTFANAAPANDYGYNAMSSREEKLETFDRFLRSVDQRYSPDMIYVACNTLSVLLPDTAYAAEATIPVKGIVESGVELLLHELDAEPQSIAIIFGTPTTIEAGTYPEVLQQHGVEPSRIISQACPGLADTISEDRDGVKSGSEIRSWVDTAVARLPRRDVPILAYLACTHYGYRRELFSDAFAAAGLKARVINPNERAVDAMFGRVSDEPADLSGSGEVTVEFVTRYAIPETTIEALTFFLEPISPRTVAAMRNFVHLPDLF
jgi:glutamate racemase